MSLDPFTVLELRWLVATVHLTYSPHHCHHCHHCHHHPPSWASLPSFNWFMILQSATRSLNQIFRQDTFCWIYCDTTDHFSEFVLNFGKIENTIVILHQHSLRDILDGMFTVELRVLMGLFQWDKTIIYFSY